MKIAILLLLFATIPTKAALFITNNTFQVYTNVQPQWPYMTTLRTNISTNVFEKFPMEQVSVPCPGMSGGVMTLLACFETRPVANPKEKTIVTKCVESITVHVEFGFPWNGPKDLVSERVLWESNRVQKLEWTDAKP